MVIYTVKTYTGNWAFAGTMSYISIQLQGLKDESNEICVDRSLFSAPCYQGSERTFEVQCKEALGELILVKLHSKPFLGLNNQWFCDKIVITTPEGDEILFPCYRWLACNESLDLRPAKALLVFQDTNKVAQEQRRKQLENRQDTYRWHVYDEDMPRITNFDSPFALPAELQFSFTKEIEIFYTGGKQLALLQLNGLARCRDSWKSIKELDALICGITNETLEYVRKNWDKDEFFGYQFLNGLNPMMIQRCSKLPKNFPVTEEVVKGLLGKSTLEAEIKKGNIFLCDYKMLDGVIGNVVNGEQQFLTAPLVLLHLDHHGLMLPIAIQLGQTPGPENPIFLPTDPKFYMSGISPQLGQTPGPENPIFLPTDSKHDWLLAKICVRAAEYCVQEVDFHLLRTHVLAEVFTLATLRCLPSIHPLYKLLIPHTRYTLHINIMARNLLITEEGVFVRLLRRGTSSLTYSSLCLPENISERGLEDVPNYYYRDDGIQLWNIIYRYVTGVLQHYYTSDEHVQKDTELQSWIREIFTNGFLGRSNTGIPESFQRMEDLLKFVTMVIFTVSAQHAALNNGQFDFGGWMPNYPSALRKPPPKEKGQTTMDTILETLPNVSTTVNSMAILKVLSINSTDHYPLGCFPEELFDEEVPCRCIKDFQEWLKLLSGRIEDRNKTLKHPYTYLNPKNVDNSVTL